MSDSCGQLRGASWGNRGRGRGRGSNYENTHDMYNQPKGSDNGGAACDQNRDSIPTGQRAAQFWSPYERDRKLQRGYGENQHEFRNHQGSPYQHRQNFAQPSQAGFSRPDMMMGRGRGPHGQSSPPTPPIDNGGHRRDHSGGRGNRGRGNGGRGRSNSRGRTNDTSQSPNQERDRSRSREKGYNQTWRRDEDPTVMLSKTLSSILRHNAERYGLKLMKGGFLYVNEILHKVWKLQGFTVEDVIDVVKSNDKQRFTLEQDENYDWKIRANQGHTIEVEDLDLIPITNADDFPVVIHGTYWESWEHIKRTGLCRMKRNHIHFAPGEPGRNGVISGMRLSCEVMIYLDLEKALRDGLKFFLSSNNVILSPGDENGIIHPRYFQGALDRYNYHRLPFDPNIVTKNASNKKKESKKQKKGGKTRNRADSHSDGPSADDSMVQPSKVPALDDESDSLVVFATSSEDVLEERSKPVEASAEVEDTGVLSDLKYTYADNEEDQSTLKAFAADKMNVAENMGFVFVMAENNGKGGNVEEEPDMNTAFISDVDVAKCTVLDLIDEEPQFVVVICLGYNLGCENSHMKELVIGAQSSLYVFSLEDKNIMEEGGLRELLLHKDIKKVFCRISEVSPSLIYEYNILLNGVPVWDLEILYSKLEGQLPSVDKETLKEMGFKEKIFKKWAQGNRRSGNDPDDLDDLKHQAVTMFKVFPILEKSISSTVLKILKKETFGQAMPNQDAILQKRIRELNLAQKELKLAQKKEKAEGKTESPIPAVKSSGKSGSQTLSGKSSGKNKNRNRKK